eukprot:9215796-Heterocapsa_arctica.AAC.1
MRTALQTIATQSAASAASRQTATARDGIGVPVETSAGAAGGVFDPWARAAAAATAAATQAGTAPTDQGGPSLPPVHQG